MKALALRKRSGAVRRRALWLSKMWRARPWYSNELQLGIPRSRYCGRAGAGGHKQETIDARKARIHPYGDPSAYHETMPPSRPEVNETSGEMWLALSGL